MIALLVWLLLRWMERCLFGVGVEGWLEVMVGGWVVLVMMEEGLVLVGLHVWSELLVLLHWTSWLWVHVCHCKSATELQTAELRQRSHVLRLMQLRLLLIGALCVDVLLVVVVILRWWQILHPLLFIHLLLFLLFAHFCFVLSHSDVLLNLQLILLLLDHLLYNLERLQLVRIEIIMF